MEPTVRLAEVSRSHEHALADREDNINPLYIYLYIYIYNYWFIYIGDGTNCALGRGPAISWTCTGRWRRQEEPLWTLGLGGPLALWTLRFASSTFSIHSSNKCFMKHSTKKKKHKKQHMSQSASKNCLLEITRSKRHSNYFGVKKSRSRRKTFHTWKHSCNFLTI